MFSKFCYVGSLSKEADERTSKSSHVSQIVTVTDAPPQVSGQCFSTKAFCYKWWQDYHQRGISMDDHSKDSNIKVKTNCQIFFLVTYNVLSQYL